jgi:hypothetical protein
MAGSSIDNALDWFDRHKFGIVGTLLIHTIILGSLTVFSIDTMPEPEDRSELFMDIDPDILEELAEMEEMDALEQGYVPVRNLRNNTALETTDEMKEYRYRPSAQATEKMVEEELREMEQQEFDRLKEERTERGEDVIIPELDKEKWDPANYIPASKPYAVKGRTTVEYDLAGRGAHHLPIPAYICKGAGVVKLRISVDREGRVRKSEQVGTSADGCMVDAALRFVTETRFEATSAGSALQEGTITYRFLAQ